MAQDEQHTAWEELNTLQNIAVQLQYSPCFKLINLNNYKQTDFTEKFLFQSVKNKTSFQLDS